MQRRDVIKGAALGMLAGAAAAQTPTGPFSLPTATFNKAGQHEFPRDAFRIELQIPLVPRPTAIGTWEELMAAGGMHSAFGPGDTTPIGRCFHGIAREWFETPPHWAAYGCQATVDKERLSDPADQLKRELDDGWAAWKDKEAHFGEIPRHDADDLPPPLGEGRCHDAAGLPQAAKMLRNWGGGPNGLPIKCYKIPMMETYRELLDLKFPTRFYSYAGMIPGPTMKMRLGQPVVVRFENHLETETSIHLHGGHSPSHSDGFPSFYVLQGKARDYFYPNILPLYQKDNKLEVDVGESQSTMWYHDHAMDATAYNASKGLSGFAPCFGEEELKLIRDGVLPGLGKDSCIDHEMMGFAKFKDKTGKEINPEHPDHPGFYKHEPCIEPYFNPYDIPLVLQDRVFDPETGQIVYDNTGHNGYIGETMVINGIPWPKREVERRKYRFRILDGSNARVWRLRLMSAEKFLAANRDGIDAIPLNMKVPVASPTPPLLQPQAIPPVFDENAAATVLARPSRYDAASENYLRIGKDSWLWKRAKQMKSLVLMMANRADIVVDFGVLTADLEPGETREFYLVNTMPQFDGRGPKAKLEDGGDPRVLPVPFDVVGIDGVPDQRLVEVNRPIPLVKFIVSGPQVEDDATVKDGDLLIQTHRPITDEEVRHGAVREFIFERGKGAWQINGRFYDPTITNAGPVLNGPEKPPVLERAEEWVLRNGGGGWWHPIHIHLESHQLISYEKDFGADAIIDRQDPPAPVTLGGLTNLFKALPESEQLGLHDTQALGPNTVARIRMRHRTWNGPFVFHCHNLEHEDMRMMFNFEPVPEKTDPDDKLPNIVPTARTHGDDVTYQGLFEKDEHGQLVQQVRYIGELPWEYPPIPQTPTQDAGDDLIPRRPRSTPKAP